LRATLLGLASWLFKSIMIVIFASLVTALLVVAFRRVEATLRSGFALGTFVINGAFDLAILCRSFAYLSARTSTTSVSSTCRVR
jgi:hypothetical protein